MHAPFTFAARHTPVEEAGRKDAGFITPELSICLDLLRAGAALMVLVCHAAQTHLYSGPFPRNPLIQHYAVVVFFVLSGLVISASVQRKRGTLAGYAVARAARILPVSLAALVFSSAAFLLAMAVGGSPLHHDSYGVLDFKGTLLPLLFMSETPFLGAGPVWNPPYWSLCYEVWYYALFGAAVYLDGWKRPATLAVMVLLAGPRVLLLLPVWLVGVAVVHAPALRRLGPRGGAVLLALAVALTWYQVEMFRPAYRLLHQLAGDWRGQLSYSRFAFSDFLLALALGTAFAGLRPLAGLAPRLLARVKPAAQRLAGFSFTLYLFHWPLLDLATTFRIGAGQSLALFALLLGLIAGICYAISLVTEQKRDQARALIEAMLARFRPSPLAMATPHP